MTSVGTAIGSLEVIDSAISNALASEIATTNAEVGSLELIDSAVSNALASEIATTDAEVGSLELIDSAVSNALASEIATTDAEVGSLELIDSAISNALASEIATTDAEVGSLELIDSAVSNALASEIATTDAEVGSLELIDSAISNALASEIATTDGEIASLQDSVDSLESQLNNFAKEAPIHGAVSGLVAGMAPAGVNDFGGANVANVSHDGVSTFTFDLNEPIEDGTEGNVLFVTVNGLHANHNAVRVGTATQLFLEESHLGYTLEPTDVVEFKYIKD